MSVTCAHAPENEPQPSLLSVAESRSTTPEVASTPEPASLPFPRLSGTERVV